MKAIKKAWTPIDVAKFNDQAVRMALFKGEYHWHVHKEDELFYVLKGHMTIQTKAKDIKLAKGEMATVPKGMKHCTKSEKGAYVLMFEPSVLKSKGN
ncbi:MAG: mannose-6-phosphate isomerase [archaeon GW2011_AR5]|nr:MAG: mannose-6-phosphate isomerase [archaeon GW2011_AR5]